MKILLLPLLALAALVATSCGGHRAQGVRADGPDTLAVALVVDSDSVVGTWLLPATATDTVPRGFTLKADSTATSVNLPLKTYVRWHLDAALRRMVLTSQVRRTVADTAAVTLADTCRFALSGDTLTLVSLRPGVAPLTYHRKR